MLQVTQNSNVPSIEGISAFEVTSTHHKSWEHQGSNGILDLRWRPMHIIGPQSFIYFVDFALHKILNVRT